MKNNNQCFYK